MNRWSLHEAKNKLSHLVTIAAHGKPQCITKRGEEAVVVIGIDEYRKLKNKGINLKEFLLQDPKFDSIETERPTGRAREADL